MAAMLFAISTAAPAHVPVVISFLKYGGLPETTAMRSCLVLLTRSNVLSFPLSACAALMNRPAGRTAAPAANPRRVGRKVMACSVLHVLKIGAGTAARQQAVTLRAIAVLCLLP